MFFFFPIYLYTLSRRVRAVFYSRDRDRGNIIIVYCTRYEIAERIKKNKIKKIIIIEDSAGHGCATTAVGGKSGREQSSVKHLNHFQMATVNIFIFNPWREKKKLRITCFFFCRLPSTIYTKPNEKKNYKM